MVLSIILLYCDQRWDIVEKFRLIIPRDRKVASWCLYDVGNSAFATTIMAAVLPVYFREIAAPFLKGSLPTAFWGYTSASALLCCAVAAPFLGAIGDMVRKKKMMLTIFTLLGVLASAGLFLWITAIGNLPSY